MQATDAEIDCLLKLQSQDMELLKVQRTFEALPQRQAILQVRQQLEQVAQKREKVLEMKSQLEKQLTKVMVEDEQLAQKQKDTQAAIDAAGGDYRNLESRTKELAGHARRRGVLADEMTDLDAQLTRVAAMEAQVDQMISQLKGQEQKQIESFKAQGGALQAQMAALKGRSQQTKQQLPAELAKLYDKIAQAGAGVAVGVLQDGRCGVCRAAIDDARMVDIRSQAPLARCPHCKRLMVVQ